jgi:hypothetical protein
MSILSKLYNFLEGTSEDISAVAAVEKLSVAIDLQAANIGDGATDLYFVAECVSGTTATGTSYAVTLQDCDTVGGTYVTKFSQTVPHVAGTLPVGEVVRAKLPNGLRQFVKATIKGSASPAESGTSLWRARIAMS